MQLRERPELDGVDQRTEHSVMARAVTAEPRTEPGEQRCSCRGKFVAVARHQYVSGPAQIDRARAPMSSPL